MGVMPLSTKFIINVQNNEHIPNIELVVDIQNKSLFNFGIRLNSLDILTRHP
jgi:hypothetical protein